MADTMSSMLEYNTISTKFADFPALRRSRPMRRRQMLCHPRLVLLGSTLGLFGTGGGGQIILPRDNIDNIDNIDKFETARMIISIRGWSRWETFTAGLDMEWQHWRINVVAG
ncbi:hypothetical protein FQN53_004727 [Emmonsiellopsis sp. PD_33]|nr:hypothetical protein FQN53_004727 [Emmonsiellopsis sp. PD_33]